MFNDNHFFFRHYLSPIIFNFIPMKNYLLLSCLFFIEIIFSQNVWTVYNTFNSSIADNMLRCIEEDSVGTIWIGTDNGISKFNGTTFTTIDSSNSGLPVNQIRSIAFDSANNLWVGTLQAGFAIFDGTDWTNYNSFNSNLPDDQVRTISFDTAKGVWLGTTGGVLNINDEGWTVYTMFNSPLGANNVNKIFIDKNNVKWIGTVNGGISKLEGNTWTVYNHNNSGLTDNTVLDLENDVYGNVWFATPAQGLGRYNGNWFFRNNVNSNIASNALSCVEITANTDVKYMGSMDKGLIRWNNNLNFDSFTVNNSPMPENNVTCMKIARDGKIYIGTLQSGLVVFNDTTTFPLVNSIEETAEESFFVYPNPFIEEFIVHSAQSIVIQGSEARIYDMEGREVLKEKLTAVNCQLTTDNLNSGIYFLKIGNSVKKLVKQ